MEPKFEVFEFKSETSGRPIGEFGFRLVASNGEVQGSGEGYTSRADAHRGAEAFKRNAAIAQIVDA